ncbi:predicted protein [Naegleria gruberi]|uniref:Predicted protein n=1 Tax=Naegleria gruberi TaxID=5762 RepID=D2VAZ2_NAEGR|nr:uncharacterized protein NAEGRDRAFT_48082 [Naegleria gruberi]EFC46166.1 predicted protein [Naegleria gruberi]|eukprot:XP_002678910.1 predicted protein [Naegleria gruberi strain NEG-M]
MAYIDNSGSHLIKLSNTDESDECKSSLHTNICTEMNDGKTIFGKSNFDDQENMRWTIMDRFKEKFNTVDHLTDPNSIMNLMSQFIKHGIQIAQNEMQNKIVKAVVGQSTVLLNRREYWKDPFRMAGISVQRTIQEPVAACLNFHRKAKGNILVIDWGSELKITKIVEEDSIFELVETYGDSLLGGCAITMELVNFCLKKLSNQILDYDAKRLFYKCERVKELLSQGSLESMSVSIGYETVNVNRDELNQIYEEKLSQIPNIMEKMKCRSIENVILCGGSFNSNYLNERVRQLFNSDINILTSSEPDEIIVRGIAQQAEYLHKPRLDNCLVSYVLPLSIGVDNDSGKMLEIIPRNTWYATSKEAELTRTVVNGSIDLNFFEGMYQNVIDNIWLGQISFQNLENDSKVKVSITMHVDDDCNIVVNALVKDIKKQIKMTKYDRTLSREEQLKMIEDSYSLGVNLPVIYKTTIDGLEELD